MRYLLRVVLSVIVLLVLSGCSQKTEFRVVKEPIDKEKRYSSASVIVEAEDIESIVEGHEDIIEEIEEEISEELKDLGIALGGELQIKITIENYEVPCMLCSGGIRSIRGFVVLSDKNNIISEFTIKYKINRTSPSTTFKFKSVKDVFVEKLIKHLEDNFLALKD